MQLHWILEIHFIDRAQQIRGSFKKLLTIDGVSTTPAPSRSQSHASESGD
jgi:hypothetical protein